MLRKVLLVAAALMVLSACSAGQAKSATDVTMEMTDFAYSPASITIPAGEPVTLTIKNAGNIEHDFVVEKIDATTDMLQDSGSEAHHAHGEKQNYDLHVSANAGETSVLELTVSEPGTYEVFCSVPGHKEAGMIGKLNVVNQQ